MCEKYEVEEQVIISMCFNRENKGQCYKIEKYKEIQIDKIWEVEILTN